MTKAVKQKLLWPWLLALLLIVVDQVSKIYVKTTMVEHEVHPITSWFKIYFIENEGMAYGITLGSKLLLSSFRLIAMSFALWAFYWLLRRRQWPVGYIVSLALILAGGWGNIIDSLFYGMIFSSSSGEVAHFVPLGEGYAPFLYGHVVDMLYFPLIHTTWPSWIPFVGGEEFIFFSPIFNFADSCITVGVLLMMLFYLKSFNNSLEAFSAER